MTGFYDGGQQPVPDHNPQQQIQWEIQRLAKGLSVDIAAIIQWFVDAAKEAVEEQLKEVVDAIIGFTSDPDHMLEQLQNWSQAIPQIAAGIVQNLKDKLTGVEGASDQDVTNWLGRLLTEVSPLNASNLFGSIASELIRVVSTGALTSRHMNLMINPHFTADAIAPGSEWSVDMSSSRTEDDNTGSGTVIANGQPHALNTGKHPDDRIPVGPGQRLPLSVYVSHDNALATGPAVILQVRRFNKDGIPIVGLVDVASYTPTVAILPWPGYRLEGTYVVEDDVHEIQGRVYVTENALQGRYRFDDGDFTQVNDLSVFPGLTDALSSLDQSRQVLINALASAARGFPIIGGEIGDLIEAFENFNPLNIAGSLGPGTAKGDLQGILKSIVAGIRGVSINEVGEVSLPDLYNAMNQQSNNVIGSDETKFVAETGEIPVNSWANYLDVVAVGNGQDGLDMKVPGLVGQGGNLAQIIATTWVKGTHYDNTLTKVDFIVNGDGSVTFSIPGHQITALPASGPLTPQTFFNYAGKGPGTLVYNGKPYAAGGVQNTAGAPGVAPGGSGAGGIGYFFQDGGEGAPGGGWLRQRAAQVTNPSTGSDTTPPTLPTPVVVEATNDTLVLGGTGSVDQ